MEVVSVSLYHTYFSEKDNTNHSFFFFFNYLFHIYILFFLQYLNKFTDLQVLKLMCGQQL